MLKMKNARKSYKTVFRNNFCKCCNKAHKGYLGKNGFLYGHKNTIKNLKKELIEKSLRCNGLWSIAWSGPGC